MIRLTIVTVLLAVALVAVKWRGRRGGSGETLRVSSRTGISRGVMAAVLEVEQRRFLVTITPTSTTLVAELGPDGAPAAVAAALPAPTAPVAPAAAPAAPHAAAPAAAPAPRRSAASAALTPVLPADASFLDRIRARTLRTYDPSLVPGLEEGR